MSTSDFRYKISDWLPITRKEADERGWDELDIVLVSGDAYVDHPSFGVAVIGRILEKQGYKVAIITQPNWQDDGRDFKKFGKPRLFFGVTAGNMDSMVNHYTANKRLRSDDAYTPAGEAGFRPDYATVVYTKMLKKIYPDTPVILGGIEASLRRVTHYDYWNDALLPSILYQSGADILAYGMAEKTILEVAKCLDENSNNDFSKIHEIPQVSYIIEKRNLKEKSADICLASHEQCLKNKLVQAENFRKVEIESNKKIAQRLRQDIENKTIIINPPYVECASIDEAFDLPYTRLPHPKYKKRGEIPAYTMIRHSINIHRGCFGGCAFCTISAHQGKFIQSRTETSILKELEAVTKMHDFKGYISDLGGPSANMYAMSGKDEQKCQNCKRPSCIFPAVCMNLNTDHTSLLSLYEKVSDHPAVKKCFIGSGVRYDMLDSPSGKKYAERLILHHVSGRLKVAPEHTEPLVLKQMRKPSWGKFVQFKSDFESICRKEKMNQQLIPYFISSHPACTMEDMKRLAEKTKALGYRLEQVQNFTPTPMTLSAEIYYAGIDPYTQEKIYVAKNSEDRKAQNERFFWYKQK